jgi:eukaryotic-like serine/threonine-protein kinase
MTQLGQYTLLDKIGSSILGAVYKAQDTVTGSTVALKVLQLGLLDDVGNREMDARLQHEFEVAARLLHPGIARVLEIRRDGTTALIATELVDGPTVTSFASACGGFNLSQAVTAVVQILEALDFAHRHGVIHRDLKPSNVLVSEGTRTKITDFAMADLGARNRDDTGMLVGETQYMAPEQFLGRAVDRAIDKRCDIHAVGTIFYELLTGKAPFAADSRSFSAMTKVLNFIPPAPSTVRPGLPASFDAVVGRALAKSPADRYESAQYFLDELCAAYLKLMGREPPGTLARVPTASDLPMPSAARTITTRRTPPSWLLHAPPDGPEPAEPMRVDKQPVRTESLSAPSASVEVAASPNASSQVAPSASMRATPARTSAPEIAPAPGIRSLREPTPAASPSRTPPAFPGQGPPAHAPVGPPSKPAALGASSAVQADQTKVRPVAPADVRSDSVVARAAPQTPKHSAPLTDASIAHGGRVLARFVGPIAVVLSRRAAQDAHDERGYYELLAAHLSDPKERAQFFRDIRQRR